MSSIAPVPKVILAPREMHDWPKSDADWSPTNAVIIGAPGSDVARPMIPMVSTMLGIITASSPSTERACWSHSSTPSATRR